ncbi:MAG: methyltransferase domain-containing protein [Rhizobiaceae bacterium]|nr:methyltransferase domain-containing protein [Rhizobiaceae bacterium]
MSDRAPTDPVAKALALDGDPDRIRDYYRDWAQSYDSDVGEEGYRAPDIIATLARAIQLSWFDAARTDLRIMDAGCGTGLGGVALQRAGFTHVDGFDIAPEMVDAARATQAYERLLPDIDLNAADPGLADLSGCYDMVTCAGVFTLGHVEPQGLDHLVDLARDGGFVIVSTREDYLKQSDYRDYSGKLEARGSVELVHALPDARYVGDDRADYWVYRKAA